MYIILVSKAQKDKTKLSRKQIKKVAKRHDRN